MSSPSKMDRPLPFSQWVEGFRPRYWLYVIASVFMGVQFTHWWSVVVATVCMFVFCMVLVYGMGYATYRMIYRRKHGE